MRVATEPVNDKGPNSDVATENEIGKKCSDDLTETIESLNGGWMVANSPIYNVNNHAIVSSGLELVR